MKNKKYIFESFTASFPKATDHATHTTNIAPYFIFIDMITIFDDTNFYIFTPKKTKATLYLIWSVIKKLKDFMNIVMWFQW